MRIESFTGDKQSHDFARAFENHINAAVAQEAFHRDGFFAATGQRFRGFIPTTTAHLHRFIGNAPGRFRRPHFAHCRFDAEIARFAIDQGAR